MTGRGSYRGNRQGRDTQGNRQGRVGRVHGRGHPPQQPRQPPDSHSRYQEKETPLERAILRAVETAMSTRQEDLSSSRSPTRSRSESSRRSHYSSRRSPSPPRRSHSSRHYSQSSRRSSRSPERQRRHYDSSTRRSRDTRSRTRSPRTRSPSRTRSQRPRSPRATDLDLESISAQLRTRLVPVSAEERRRLDPQGTGRQLVRVQPWSAPPPPGSRQPYQGPDRRQVFEARSVSAPFCRTYNAPQAQSFIGTRQPVEAQPVVGTRQPVEAQPVAGNQPIVGNQPIADNRPTVDTRPRREFVYKSPERPSYIPPATPPKRLPMRTNCPDHFRTFFLTDAKGLSRIGIHSTQRIFGSIRHFLIDVKAFGFVVLYIDPLKAPIDTLTLCSPSGHVHLVQKGEKGLLLPKEFYDLLFQNTDIKKVSLYSREIVQFQALLELPAINVIEIHPVIRKNLLEINNGVLNFLKYNLGPDVPSGRIDILNDDHVRTAATYSRAIAYGIWLVAARFAQKAGLQGSANLCGYMRYALLSETGDDKYRQLLVDPYYVSFDENFLSPLHQSELDDVMRKYKSVHQRTMRAHRPRFVKPFDPLLTDKPLNCMTCGVFVKPGSEHNCGIVANCPYPVCEDKHSHSPIMCRYIRAWCLTCQRRGHLARHHETFKYPPPYLWALFIHYQCINLDTSLVMKDRKFENPFFHMFTLYGLPPSNLPKAAFETTVGQDKPDDPCFKRPVTLPIPFPQFPIQDFVIPKIQNTPQTSSSVLSVQPTVRRPSRLVHAALTRFELQRACMLAERISRGDVAGTSGTSTLTPVVTELVKFVNNLKKKGAISLTPSQPADLIDLTSNLPDTETTAQSGGQPSLSTPSVVGQSQVTQSGQTSTSVSERTADVPIQPDINDDDSSESSSDSSEPEVIDDDTSSASRSSSSEDDRQDQAGVTETAAGVFYDNQEHILDRPITDSELEAAISPVITYLEQPPRGPNPN